MLIENGANVNTVDKEGWSPIHHAAFGKHSTIAKLLCEHGANSGRNPLDGVNLDQLHPSARAYFTKVHGIIQKYKR